jgi:glycosyltransferase involved in cell wall biosynthesis
MTLTKRFLFVTFWIWSVLFGIIPCYTKDYVKDKIHFFVLICSYNNAQWCEKNLESVFSQKYPNWTIYYVDDCSTDGTGDIVERYIKKRGFSDKCVVVHNATNKKACANYYYALKDCDPHKVIVNLDGDDWLAHPSVLKRLAEIYKDSNIWLTFGSYMIEPEGIRGCSEALPDEVMRNHTFRQYKWVFSHLRTYYAALYQKIPKEDFFFKGTFFSSSTDMSYMFPMMEMAANGHYRYVEEIMYIYNSTNPISIFRTNREKQIEAEMFIRSKPPYKPLEKLF